MANSDIHSTFFLGATSHLTNNTIIKITWKTDKPIWTEQWPLTKEKLQVAKKLIDYAKAFDFVDHNKLWKILKEVGIPDHLTSSWETCVQVMRQELELDKEQQTGSK